MHPKGWAGYSWESGLEAWLSDLGVRARVPCQLCGLDAERFAYARIVRRSKVMECMPTGSADLSGPFGSCGHRMGQNWRDWRYLEKCLSEIASVAEFVGAHGQQGYGRGFERVIPH